MKLLNWTDEQLEAAGLDKKKVQSLVRRLRRCSDELWAMNLHVYGASGYGHLVHVSRPTHRDEGPNLVADKGCSVADIGEGFDGGDW